MLLLVLPPLVWQLAPPYGDREVSSLLTPGLIRVVGAELERVAIPVSATLVRLQLDLAIDKYSSYRAALHLAAGDEIWTQSKLEAESTGQTRAVTLVLPSELFLPGDYYVRLSGVSAGGEIEPLDRYDFRVLRE
jgi:hypothetical protein